jgi:3-phenylpropionate/cinnamic acid dioxygenase small subunit
MDVDRYQIEAFLYREARLMDEYAYDEWLALWTSDAHYWIPSHDDDTDPTQTVALIYDDRERLEERIARLKSGATQAQEPKSRLRRLIANVEIMADAPEAVVVRANFCLMVSHHRQQQLVAGHTIHTLRPHSDGFKIAAKKVILVNNEASIDNFTFLI